MIHTRIRVKNGVVEEAPLDYVRYPGREGWTDIRVIEIRTEDIKNSRYIYSKGNSVSEIARKQTGNYLCFNASYVDVPSGQILGKTIADGEKIAPDIPSKTEERPCLWWDGKHFGISKVASKKVEWAAQGSPLLLKNGKRVLSKQAAIENTPNNIVKGHHPRTAAGIKGDGTLVLIFVDGRASSDAGITLEDLTILFERYGCNVAINLDGGGSSTIATNIKGLQKILKITQTHICDQSIKQPRVVHHAVYLGLKGADSMDPFEGYRITSHYGWRNDPFTGERKFHTGIDLVKNHRDPIYAFTGGKVIFASFGQTGSGFGGYGNVVAIEDEYGALHCYCHLDSCSVRVGEVIQKGRMIGRQGSTGQSTGSHLHYEIRKKSAPKFGWIPDKEDMCYSPVPYLYRYEQKKEGEVKLPQIQGEAKVVVGDREGKGYLINNSVYVPIRFVSEALGHRISWDNKNKAATIYVEGVE